MNDRERMKWIMSVCLVTLCRPREIADPEEWAEFEAQRERLLELLPPVSSFMDEAP